MGRNDESVAAPAGTVNRLSSKAEPGGVRANVHAHGGGTGEGELARLLGGTHDRRPQLTFVGSGDFHHVSLALARRLVLLRSSGQALGFHRS